MMKDDPSLNLTTLPALDGTWNRSNCSLDMACDYTPPQMHQRGPPNHNQEPATEFSKPASCPSGTPSSSPSGSSSGLAGGLPSGGPGGRRKRMLFQAGPEPKPLPEQETPNADANAYAKFLVKYMALGKETRFNIGHKVIISREE